MSSAGRSGGAGSRASGRARQPRPATSGATTTFVVLLRGVNVGKSKRVPMADFKSVLLALGCVSASTLLNSGNAVVTAPFQSSADLATTVAAAIEACFGFAVPVIVKTVGEFDRVVDGNALAEAAVDHSRLLVAFAQETDALARLAAIGDLVCPPEQFVVGEHAAFLHCANGILESKAADALLGRAGTGVTTRNWATVLKIRALLGNGSA